MDSSNQEDKLSSLPDVILLMIMSFLSFKDNLKTSILSRRWKTLCYDTKNIAFRESEYVDHSVSDEASKKVSFALYIRRWISRFQGLVIQSFELCFPFPVGFVAEIEFIIRFVVAKNVKNLVLDFSNPAWKSCKVKDWWRLDVVVRLPESLYGLETLESLQISGCRFDPLRFKNLRLLRRLSIGWTSLRKVESLISKSPLLESLSLCYCWSFDILTIGGNMREFVFENCYVSYKSCLFSMPKVDIFKYSGYVYCLDFESMNSFIKEVYLDFGEENEYDDPYPTKPTGDIVSKILNDLRLAKTLTVDPYLLQVIQECDHPLFLLRPMETTHLLLRTKMHPKEFKGIRILFANCPNLVQLTLDILPLNSIERSLSYACIDRRTHYMQNMTYQCLSKTLKVVVVRNFGYRMNEFDVLNYLIGTVTDDGFNDRGSGSMLERIEVYEENGLEKEERKMARFETLILQAALKGVQLIMPNAC